MFIILVGTLAGLAMVASRDACALPAFARQTGQACVACHVSFPELTPYGRNFKLSGYTIGTRQTIPLAFMAQAGVTEVKNNKDDQGNAIVPKTDSLQLSAATPNVVMFESGPVMCTDSFMPRILPPGGVAHISRVP